METTTIEVAELSIWIYPDDTENHAPDIEIGDTYVHPEFPCEKATGSDLDGWQRQAVALAERHGWRVANGVQWQHTVEAGTRWRIRILRDVPGAVRLSVIESAWDRLTFAVGPLGGEALVSVDVDRFAYADDLAWQMAAVGWSRNSGFRWVSGCSWHPVKGGHVTFVTPWER